MDVDLTSVFSNLDSSYLIISRYEYYLIRADSKSAFNFGENIDQRNSTLNFFTYITFPRSQTDIKILFVLFCIREGAMISATAFG